MMNFQMMTFSWILRKQKNEKGGFLEGTKLTGYSEQKPKKKGKLLKKQQIQIKQQQKQPKLRRIPRIPRIQGLNPLMMRIINHTSMLR